MSYVIHLVGRFEESKDVALSAMSAEKAKVGALKAEAKRLFSDTYSEYDKMQALCNISFSTENRTDPELHLVAAEAAFATKDVSAAKTIVTRYLVMGPQEDQFYCRAKLLYAEILNWEAARTNGVEAIAEAKRSMVEVLACLDVATKPENSHRYKFLVYNASVVAWRILQPFVRPGRAKFFADEILRLSAALEKTNDDDKEWRIMYLAAAGTCLLDAGKGKEGADQVDVAIAHAEAMVASTKGEQTIHEAGVLEATEKTEVLMGEMRELEERVAVRTRKPKLDPDAEDEEVAAMGDLGFDETGASNAAAAQDVEEKMHANAEAEALEQAEFRTMKDKLDVVQAAKARFEDRLRKLLTAERAPQEERCLRLCLQRVHLLPADFKKIQGSPFVTNSFRARALVNMQACVSNGITDKDWPATFDATIKEAEAGDATMGAEEAESLLDLCRAAWRLQLREQAMRCFELASAINVSSPACTVKKDLCQAIKIVADLDQESANSVLAQRVSEKQAEGYLAERRIEAVTLIERVLTVCIARVEDNALLEEICSVLWTSAVPLTQPHLRMQCHRAFAVASCALEDIASPLMRLRSQLHFEVSKCEDMTDFVGKAKIEAVKAFELDYGVVDDAAVAAHPLLSGGGGAPAKGGKGAPAAPAGGGWSEPAPEVQLDRSRDLDRAMAPAVGALEMRSDVYNSPSDAEGRAVMMLQQAKESRSKAFQQTMLTRTCSTLLEGLIDSGDGYPYLAGVGIDAQEVAGYPKGRAGIPDRVLLESPLEDVLAVLAHDRSKGRATEVAAAEDGGAPTTEVAFTRFTKVVQSRVLTLADVAVRAQSLKLRGALACVQAAAVYCLDLVWDPADAAMSELIASQANLHFVLAESLVEQLADLWIDDDQGDAFEAAQNEDPDLPDPRALGTTSPFESASMTALKAGVLACLQRGLELAVLVNDKYQMQNAMIFFWNLHLHIFRSGLYVAATDAFSTFVYAATAAAATMADDAAKATVEPGMAAKLPVVDARLRLALVEAQAELAAARGDVIAGVDVAAKGCAAVSDAAGADPSPPIYLRKGLAQTCARLVVYGTRTGGGKGGEPPKLDQPILNVYAMLAQAEEIAQPTRFEPGADRAADSAGPASLSGADKTVVTGLANKVGELLVGEVKTYVESLDMDTMNQVRFDQVKEMLAECQARLTRTRIAVGDIHGAQHSADACLQLVAQDALSSADQKRLSPRVWRWISICERYFGLAIAQIINPEGQDPSLQYELRLAALRHFALACDFGNKAQVGDCVIAASISAWNVSLHLVEVADVRDSLRRLQRQVLDALLPVARATDDPRAWTVAQQLYLSLIDEETQVLDWDAAMALVNESFAELPAHVQKPLWKWRVVVMSKKGKNVMGSLQKMKESDTSLQAGVFGILARSASNPRQQLDAYQQAIEILNGNILQVDYMLETCQWMASSGMPKSAIEEVLNGAMDSIYEAEEAQVAMETKVEGADEDDEDEDGSVSSRSSRPSTSRSKATSRKSSSSARPGTGTGAGGRKGGKSGGKSPSRKDSVAGSTRSTAAPQLPPDADEASAAFTFKHADLAVRALAMALLLQADQRQRTDKALEAVYFMARGLDAWQAALMASYKGKKFMEMPSSVRDVTEFRDWQPSFPASMVVPRLEDLSTLLQWAPSATSCPELMAQTGCCKQSEVPSAESVASPTLTVHYVLAVVDQLVSSGHIKSALQALGYARCVLLFMPQLLLGGRDRLALFALLDTRARRVLVDAGAMAVAGALPELLGDTDMRVAKYVSSMDTRTQLVSPTEALPNEALSPFGFDSFTHAIRGVRLADCWLTMAEDLLQLGQVATCERIVRAAFLEYSGESQARGVARASVVLAEVHLLCGRAAEAIACLLNIVEALKAAGDALLLSRATKVLLQAYVQMGQAPDAVDIALETLAVLDRVAQVVIGGGSSRSAGTAATSRPVTSQTSLGGTPAPPGTAQTSAGVPPPPGTAQTSVSTVASQAGTRSVVTAGTTTGGTSLGSRPMDIESSWDNVAALVSVGVAYTQLLVRTEVFEATGSNKAQLGRAVLETVDRVRSVMDGLHAVVAAVHGSLSEAAAELLGNKAELLYAIARHVHGLRSEVLTMDAEEYSAWMDGMVADSVRVYGYATDIYRGLVARISFDEGMVSVEAPAPAVEAEAAAAPKGKKGAPVPEPAAAAAAPSPDGVAVTPRVKRSLATLLSRQALASVYLGSLRGEDLPPLSAAELQTRSGIASHGEAVDAYLADTLPAEPLVYGDFLSPPIFLGLQLASSIRDIYAGGVGESEGTGLFALAELRRLMGRGSFRHAWGAVDSAIAEENALTPDAEAAVGAAKSSVTEAIASHKYELAAQLCSVLAECLGRSWADEASVYMLTLQSLLQRVYLRGVWVAALNPISEAAATLRRVEALEALALPTLESQIQLTTERAYMRHLAPAWLRLDCSGPAADVIAKLPAPTAWLTVQFCARDAVLFVGFGACDDEGVRRWTLDSITLQESSRRLLQQLTTAHADWIPDTTRFVASFGDSTSAEQVLAGTSSPHGDVSMDKAERSLEKRLGATLASMDDVLACVVGEGSPVGAALAAHAAANDGASALLLAVDAKIQDLPWEGLSAFAGYAGRISRDYSIHLLGHRLNDDGDTVAADKVRIVVDPFGDDEGNSMKGSERPALRAHVADLCTAVPGGGAWQPLTDGPTPSSLCLHDWVTLGSAANSQREPRSVFVLAPGRLGGLISPRELSALNLSRVVLFAAVDQGFNNSSYRRQNTGDNVKTQAEILAEQSARMSVLLSLAGARVVLQQSWAGTFMSQQRFSQVFWSALASGSSDVSAAAAAATVATEAEATAAAAAAGGVSGTGNEGAGGATPAPALKRWVALSRTVIGSGFTAYADK